MNTYQTINPESRCVNEILTRPGGLTSPRSWKRETGLVVFWEEGSELFFSVVTTGLLAAG